MTPGPTGAWPGLALRRERHYGDRVFLCHAARPRDFPALIAETVAGHAADEAIVAGSRRLSYGELDRLAGNVAGNLARHGIGAGDRVALLLCNCPEFAIYLIACLRLGAIAVPLGARLKAPELETALNDFGAAALGYESEYAGNLPDPSALPSLRLRILIDGRAAGAEPGGAFLEPAARPFHEARAHTAREGDTAIILYTSGTTGRPKGAMLTHLGIIHSAL